MAVTVRRARIALTAVLIAVAALAPSASVPASFDGGRLVDAGNREIGLGVGDFNEDGYADVLTANSNGSADLLINRQDNWFFMAPGFPRSVGGNNQSLVVGDFNEDTHLDAAIVSFGPDELNVILGDGAGGVLSAATVGLASQPFDVATGDVNGDGHLDLVTANQANGSGTPGVSVLLGNGAGAFSAASPRDYAVGAGSLPRGVAVGDVTGDGQADIVVVLTNSNLVRILTGAGDGTFTLSPTSYATTNGPRKVVLGDFDENGSLDIATADSGDGVPAIPANRNNKTTVLLNDGSGAFTPAAGSPFTTGPSQSSPFAIRAGDLNGDGHLDLAFVNRFNASLSFLTGAGDGTFAAAVVLPYPEFDPASPPEATDIAVGDINHDGKPDLIANVAGSPGFLVPFLNTTTIAPPTLSATSPASPSNVATPLIQGTTDGATVTLYVTNDCTGLPEATGTKAEFEGAGLTVPVPPDTTTTYYATTTNAAGWATSSCSSTSASYTHDGIAPDAPTIASSSPASPSLDPTPELLGTAEAGSTIRIYASSNCSGSPVTTGTAAGFVSPGLTATAAALTTTTFTATATDAAGNTSLCSSPFTYVACRMNPLVTAASDHPAIPNELRDAIAEACTGSTITFAMDPKTILLSGALVLSRDVTIDGANEITISQGVNAPVFRVQSGVVTLKGLTIRDGLGDVSGSGGGVSVSGGSLTIRNSSITNNEAYAGAGVGISAGSVAIIDSTISGNQVNEFAGIDGVGGGIARQFAGPDPGTLTIENTTISGNSARGDGGGIYNDAPGLSIVNATITNNRADSDSDGSLAAGGIRSLDDVVVLKNTIVAGNTVTGNSPGDMRGHVDASRSFYNLIGADAGISGTSNGSDGNQIGTQANPIDARLGPLANNGGPTLTHALLAGSPALDAGSNGNPLPIVSTADQRGCPRVLDGPDANTIQTVDLGAVEQNPSIEDIADRTIFEDTATAASPLQITFNLGDPSGGDSPGNFESVTATSSNQALVTDANLTVTGSGSTRTLSIVTELNAFGTATITVTVRKDVGGSAFYASDTFLLTVNGVNDAPAFSAIATQTVAEDSGSHTVPLTGITAGPGESQVLTLSATSSNPSIVPDPIVTYSSPDATASLAFTPAADKFGIATFTVTVQDDGGTADGGVNIVTRFFSVVVTPVADTPQVTSASAFVNTPTVSGLVITPNAVDGAEVQVFKITSIQNGTLTLAGTATAVGDGALLSRAQGLGGLSFTPAQDSTSTGSFDVMAQVNSAGSGASAPVTVSIPVVKHSTATSVSTTPNPSIQLRPVTVNVTVSSTTGGPTPTGSVEVHIAGSSETCSATLDGSGAGSCQISPADAGVDRVVTATYAGDGASDGSAGTTNHTVVTCFPNPVVLNTADNGSGSLRQAIADACGTDTITFDLPGDGPHTIALLNIPLNLSKSLTITGPTTESVTITAGTPMRLASVGPGALVTIENLTLAGGHSPTSGGAITSSGDLTIRNSTLSGNQADANGGAIEAFDGSVAIYNSTLSGNSASSNGAAIWSLVPVTLVNATVTANTGPDTIFWGDSLTVGNSIVAGNTAQNLSLSSSGTLIHLGHNLLSGDPKLGPLQDNGGPTFTHALVANSSALDAGDDALAAAWGITLDQRGVARAFDGPDADTTATIDIGAFEARASIGFTDTLNLLEGSAGATVTLNLGDAVTLVSATTSIGPLFLPPAGWGSLAISGTTTDLVIPSPGANTFGTQTVDITAFAGGDETLHATLTVNVLPVADTPSITDAASDEDTQTTSGLVVTRSIVDGPEVGYLKILSVVNGTLYKQDGVTPIAAGAFTPIADGEAGLRFSRSPNSNDTGFVTVRASLSASDAGLGGDPVTASIFLSNAIPDPPQVSNVTTLEDTQSGLISVLPNAVDASGPTIRTFVISGITGGTLYLDNGVTAVSDGNVISVAQGAAGLRFTPSLNSMTAGHFTARAGFSGGGPFGPEGTTATITVTPVADTPSATAATTYAQKQTTSGLRLQRNAADGAEVTHFKISGITNGTLFQHDGVTPIAAGAFITFAQGDAGLTFTPSNGFVGAATFQVQASTDGAGGGLSPAATATITVDKHLTATTITSHTPNPVDRNTPLNVSYSVVSTTGGPVPTGTVTVTLGARSCTGTVAARHCTFSPNTGGSGQTLTATYNGDALSQSSTTSVLQDVNACPTKFVTTTADSGPGSLRQAIADSCSRDLVRFDIPGVGPHTIALTSGPLVVDKVIWFLGPLDERVRISGNHASRVFDVTGAGATFTGLEIVDGAADEGAGIRTVGGTTLDGVTLSGNVATVKGGGILASAAPYLEIFSSTVSGNTAPSGSALWSADSEVSIGGSTVTANTGGTAVENLSFGATTFFAQLQNSIVTGNDPSDRSGAFSDNGGNLLTGDPLLGPLQDNGGPTFTHMPLAGSPAIDAGSNTLATDVTDQRGFARVADGPDADQTATVDIGAVEAIPSVGFMARTNMSEDGVRTRTFLLGTIAEPFTSIVATSSDQTLLPNASLVITGGGDERTLTITPATNRSGTVTITVAATAQIQNGATGVTGPLTSSSSFQVVVLPVADTPSVTNASTPANQQTTGGLVLTRNAADGAEVTHYQITAITGGALFQHDGVTPIAGAAFITVAQGAAGLRFTPATGSLATGHFSVRASIGGTVSGLGGATVTADITVGQATSAVAVSTSGRPSALGRNVTFTATVTPAAATGTVQFMDGASALGAPVPLSGGTATLTTASLALGTHAIAAAYSGDVVYLSSTGSLGGGQTVIPVTVSLITGADAGGSPHVRRFMALDGSVPTIGALNSFFPFDPSFTGGVRVAEGDVNGDGVPDYIVGSGAGGPTEVRIVDGATGVLRASLVPFGSGYLGGVYVAAGDVNGDGFVDVIAGSGEGHPGQIKVYSGRDFSVLIDETLLIASGFAGGVRVAAGDVNGDGFADLVIGESSTGSTVTVLSGANLSVLRTFTAYSGFPGGIYVAAGDVTGDGYADIITGPGAGGGPHVKVFDGRTGAETYGFFAFDPAFTGGVRVAAGDVNGDGHAEIIVAAGPGGAPEVRVFDPVTTTLVSTVLAYVPAFTGGVFVATAVPVGRMAIDAPVAGSTIRGIFTVTGWAFEEGGSGAGIAGIDVAAVSVGGGVPIALGAATTGGPRPDVAAIYGAQYANAGFQLAVSGLAPGVYDLRVTARGAVSGTANLVRTVRITVAPDPQPLLAIDIPVTGRLSSGDFVVSGWALTPETLPAPGVDAIHVWTAPIGGGAWHFLGAAVLGLPRPDVAIAFGSQYAAAGYYLNVTGLAPGTWDLLVFPRRTGTAAFAAPRVVRVTVPGGSTRSIITGADAGGGPHVKRFDALDGGLPAVGALSSFFAFDGTFTGGVRVAEGDVTGDGVPDYIAAAGPGAAPDIRIIDGALGVIRASITAFEPDFRGGVFVAAGDVNGDGFVDVIAGSGEGRRGEVKVFSGRDASLLRDVFVFDAAFRGGVHVAAGDVNGDGYADLVVGSGAGGTEVLVLNATDLSTLWTVTPYAGFLGGAWVAAGDVTGDGFADVITGAGPGGGPHVRVFNGRTGIETRNFFAYEPEFAGGVRVAVGDATGDGRADIITGAGQDRASDVRVFDAATAALLSNVVAYPGFTAGVFVATAAPVNRMAIDTPANNATVHGAFAISGWAFDEHPSTAGLDAIHVWAFPIAGGAPTFGGVATLGIARSDVATLYGAQYANAGFHVDIAGLAPGVYDVVIFGHSSVSGTFNLQRVVRVTVTP